MSLKFVYSGSSNFSLYFLKLIILNLKIKFLLIGGDFNLNFNLLKIFCLKKRNVFFQFKNLFFYNNYLKYNIYFFTKIRKINFNFFIIFDYWMIFSIFFIKIPYYGTLNIHISILPFYKGSSPIFNIIYNKNIFLGFSVIFINNYIDFGVLIFYFKLFYIFALNIFLFLSFFLKKLNLFFLKLFKFNFSFKFYQLKIKNIFFIKWIK